MSREQLARYREVIVDLQGRQELLHASRRFYLRTFVAIAVISVFGYAWNKLLGAATFMTGILMCAFGFYVVLIRESEFRTEMKNLRRRERELAADIETEPDTEIGKD